jgi:hypothetical protein
LPAPVAISPVETLAAVVRAEGRPVPLSEVGPPVVILSFLASGTRDALSVATSLAEQSRSRVLIASDHELPESQAEVLAAESGVPFEYVSLGPAKGPKGMKAAAHAIKNYADRLETEMIVVPVEREVFSKWGRKDLGWIEELAGKRVVLLSAPPGQAGKLSHPSRLLIPVLDEFHPEVFALAGALTSSAHIPDVDIVAAKVIRIPQSIPLYSTYRPESLVDAEKELSFLKPIRGLPLLRRLTGRVLLVRDIGTDLVEFAREKRVDMIILQGDWALSRQGLLPKKERVIAEKAPCTVAVMLPASR